MECPYCKNYVADDTKKCKCGYVFKGYDKSKSHTAKKNQKVKVVDFNMSFGNMVIFMVKWVIASIPAMIILFFIWMALMMIVGGSIDWSIEI